MTARNLVIVALKLGFSGAVIVAIAAIFLVVSDDGDVSEAQADLYDLHSADVYAHGDFERVLEDSGLEPRPYDLNGNFVNFAVGESELTPAELMEYYQHKFERAGINSEVYDEAMFSAMASDDAFGNEDLRDAQDAFWQGEMVPLSVSDEHVAMAGLLGAVDPEDERYDNFKDQLQSADLSHVGDQRQLYSHLEELGDLHLPPVIGAGDVFEDDIEGFRFLEAHREPGTATTTVTSTWSDGEFDARKMNDPDADGVGADGEVPACIGCQRDKRLQALNDDEPYVLNQFRTTSPPEQITSFYRQAMPRRDWTPTETDEALEALKPHVLELQQMPGHMVNFERGDEFLTVFVADQPDAGGERGVVTLYEEAPPVQ